MILRLLFGEGTIGSYFVNWINGLQLRGKCLWLRHVGLVSEVGGYVWMCVVNVALYAAVLIGLYLVM